MCSNLLFLISLRAIFNLSIKYCDKKSVYNNTALANINYTKSTKP